MEIVAFLVLILFAVPIQHMAFGRHPRWQKRELSRRAIGIGTVMGLALIPVILGDLDGRTWAVLLAGFTLGGVELFVMTRWEKERLRAARRELHGHIARWEGKEAD